MHSSAATASSSSSGPSFLDRFSQLLIQYAEQLEQHAQHVQQHGEQAAAPAMHLDLAGLGARQVTFQQAQEPGSLQLGTVSAMVGADQPAVASQEGPLQPAAAPAPPSQPGDAAEGGSGRGNNNSGSDGGSDGAGASAGGGSASSGTGSGSSRGSKQPPSAGSRGQPGDGSWPAPAGAGSSISSSSGPSSTPGWPAAWQPGAAFGSPRPFGSFDQGGQAAAGWDMAPAAPFVNGGSHSQEPEWALEQPQPSAAAEQDAAVASSQRPGPGQLGGGAAAAAQPQGGAGPAASVQQQQAEAEGDNAGAEQSALVSAWRRQQAQRRHLRGMRVLRRLPKSVDTAVVTAAAPSMAARQQALAAPAQQQQAAVPAEESGLLGSELGPPTLDLDGTLAAGSEGDLEQLGQRRSPAALLNERVVRLGSPEPLGPGARLYSAAAVQGRAGDSAGAVAAVPNVAPAGAAAAAAVEAPAAERQQEGSALAAPTLSVSPEPAAGVPAEGLVFDDLSDVPAAAEAATAEAQLAAQAGEHSVDTPRQPSRASQRINSLPALRFGLPSRSSLPQQPATAAQLLRFGTAEAHAPSQAAETEEPAARAEWHAAPAAERQAAVDRLNSQPPLEVNSLFPAGELQGRQDFARAVTDPATLRRKGEWRRCSTGCG